MFFCGEMAFTFGALRVAVYLRTYPSAAHSNPTRWSFPLAKKKAVLTKSVSLDGPVSHLAIDAINNGESKVEIVFEEKQDGLIVGSKSFLLNYKAGRRL